MNLILKFRGSVPPGARFDPIGPFGTMPTRPPGRGGLGRGGRNFHSGDPDNDELPPPVSTYNINEVEYSLTVK